ncbi:hypothetical protein [Humisphaera borealis]|uniref:DUF1559 domain-containing protein n=1 Tax=Humisphaera borealis TaxID=2807512 RepID=A0A7M2X189_9BACT|nr:hypothetical protein [Humisphaera borealis]QOV91434.1 hypothetical protein IPV69_08790 [Humisphaera borealis]
MRNRGLALVELLVVVGIVAVLLGLLLPVLGRARESGRRAVCLSNLRQVGQVVQMYGQNNAGRVPIGYRAGFKQFNSMVYSGTAQKFCLFGVLYMNKKMDPPQAFFCPSNEDPQSNLGSELNPWPPKAEPTRNVFAGYAFRPDHQIVDEVHLVGGFMPTLASFGTKAILADLTATPQRVDLRHREGVNVLYGDFSGSWVSRASFETPLKACPTSPSTAANPYQDQIWTILDSR